MRYRIGSMRKSAKRVFAGGMGYPDRVYSHRAVFAGGVCRDRFGIDLCGKEGLRLFPMPPG